MRIREAEEQFREVWSKRKVPAVHGDEQLDDPEESIAQRVAFFEWARAEGLTTAAAGVDEFVEGGREHLIRELSNGKILKATIPPGMGYHVDFDDKPELYPNQHPLRYLQRFVDMQEVWAFETELIGVVGSSSLFSIIISQNMLKGVAATNEEIREHMKDLGFTELKLSLGYAKSLSFFNEEFAVFDLRPANVVKMTEGPTSPIDCFIERLEPDQFQLLRTLSPEAE